MFSNSLSWLIADTRTYVIYLYLNIKRISASLGLCDRNPVVTDGFPSQRTSNAESVYMSRGRHVECIYSVCRLYDHVNLPRAISNEPMLMNQATFIYHIPVASSNVSAFNRQTIRPLIVKTAHPEAYNFSTASKFDQSFGDPKGFLGTCKIWRRREETWRILVSWISMRWISMADQLMWQTVLPRISWWRASPSVRKFMITSWHENVCRITGGPLCWKSTGHRCFPLTKGQ